MQGKEITPKEYLSQIKRLDVQIRQRIEQKEELRQLCGLAGQGMNEKVQSSPKGEASFVWVIEKIEAIEKEINGLINKYVDTKSLIIKQIQALPDVRYSEVLFQRYVKGKRLEAIAVDMNYSYHRVKHIHGYALKAFGQAFSDCLKIDT